MQSGCSGNVWIGLGVFITVLGRFGILLLLLLRPLGPAEGGSRLSSLSLSLSFQRCWLKPGVGAAAGGSYGEVCCCSCLKAFQVMAFVSSCAFAGPSPGRSRPRSPWRSSGSGSFRGHPFVENVRPKPGPQPEAKKTQNDAKTVKDPQHP